MEYKKNIKTTIRIPKELLDKIELFKKESQQKTNNISIIKLLELGLIRYQEDQNVEEFLFQILKQNNYIIKLLEELNNESKS